MNKLIFGMVLVVLTVALAVPTAALEEPIFHLVAEDSSCDPGDTVTVWVNATVSHDDINEGQASIIFDPSVVNVTFAEMGPYPNWYMWEWYVAEYDGNTYVTLRGSDVLGEFGPGEIVFGKITLQGVNPGISSLHFGNTSELGADRTRIGNASGAIWPITTEDGTFTCGDVQTFTKPLPEGWNLISLPLTPTDSGVDAVLSGVTRNAVKRYDATSKQFEDATTMDPGIGYFVHVTESGGSTWSYQGSPAYTTNPGLKSGLNMIGVPNCTMSVGAAMGSADYRYVARWNADAQEYEVYNPVAPSAFHGFTEMAAGEGYFVSAKSDCALNINCPG